MRLLLSFPEDFSDRFYLIKQLLAFSRVGVLLARTRLLKRSPKLIVQIRILLKMLGLKIVGPQYHKVMFNEFGALFLNE